MFRLPHATSLARPSPAAALALGLPLLGALVVGGDSNWDLRNYHLYGPHALLAGRMALDIAPAQLQGFHNPILDVPFYLIATSGLSMRLATLWLALPAMLALWSLLRLHALLSPTPVRAITQGVLSLLVITGAAFWSTFGTTMNDGFVVAGMCAALWLALDDRLQPREARRWLLAGLVAGATAGLKLSSAFYCVALAAAALPGGDPGGRLRRLLALALGGCVGVALTYGAWAWHLSSTLDSPVFPYLNQVFHSPSAMPWSFADARFRPHTIGDALLAPFRLLRSSQLYSELKLRDPRVLLGLLSFTWLAWTTRNAATDAQLAAKLRALAAFFVVGLASWLLQSGIYRYAIVIEALGALALVLALQRQRRWHAWLLPLALLLVNMDTRRPHWGRDADGSSFAAMQAPGLGDGAMVVTASGDPLGYLALGMPDDVPIIGLANNLMQPDRCTRMQLRASHRLAAAAGPLWLLEDPSQPGAPTRAILRQHYGLATTDACLPYPNPLAPAQLCPLRRGGPARAPCVASEPGAVQGAPR